MSGNISASQRSNEKSAAVFDLDSSLARLGGSRELFCNLVQFFLEDYPVLLEQLQTGLDRGDVVLVERAGHSIKGLAANFSAASTVQAALRVEELGHAGDLAGVGKVLPQFKAELERLQQALSDYLHASQR